MCWTQKFSFSRDLVILDLKLQLASLLDYAYRPDKLMAVAAEAITNGFMSAFDYASIDDFNRLMCYPHVN
jgi:hypothetical protein